MMAEISVCDLLVCLFNVRMALLLRDVTSTMSKELLLIYTHLYCYQNRLNLDDYYFQVFKKTCYFFALVDVCDAINTILDELRFLITITSKMLVCQFILLRNMKMSFFFINLSKNIIASKLVNIFF